MIFVKSVRFVASDEEKKACSLVKSLMERIEEECDWETLAEVLSFDENEIETGFGVIYDLFYEILEG